MNCPLCRDTGWVEIEPRGTMRRHAPCHCAAGEAGAKQVADFVNGNYPDAMYSITGEGKQ